MNRSVTLSWIAGLGIMALAIAGCSQQPTTLSGPVAIVADRPADTAMPPASERAGGSDAARDADPTEAAVATKTVVLHVPGMH
jgi:hypothetical protein